MTASYGVLGENAAMSWMKRCTGLLLAGLACLASAQIPGLSPAARPSAEVSTPQVRARLLVQASQGVLAGQSVWLGLELTHQPDWHTYWRQPGDSGLPTQLEWQLPAGVSAGDIVWPLPRKLRAGPLTNYGYDGTTLLVVPLQVDARAAQAPQLDIRLHANWLVCRLECIPQEGDFALTLPTQVSQAAHAPAFDAVLRQQPPATPLQARAQFDGPHLAFTLDGLPPAMRQQRVYIFPEQGELLHSATEQHPLALQSWQDQVLRVRLPQSAQRHASPSSLGLLLTSGEGTARVAARVQLSLDAPWPAAPADIPPAPDAPEAGWGFWLALLGAFGGGILLNLMPCVLPVLALKVMAFARHSHAHRAHRVSALAYTAGVLLSFLALGAAVIALRAAGEQLGWGFQLQSPWVVGALALLFTLIAFNLFGWLEFGQLLPSAVLSLQARHPVLDAFFSGVLAVAVASPCTAPFMGASLGVALTLPAWQALSVFASIGLGLALPYLLASWWPAVAERLPRPGPWMITLRRWLGVPMLATVAWLLWVLAQQIGPARVAEAPEGWQAWSEQAVAQSLADGKPVFIDFTAAWCVTCQVNKRTTLADPEVRADWARRGVTLLRADWTRRDPAITAALTALGRSGVPVYVLQAPGQAPQVLSELLTPTQVREALARLDAATPKEPQR